MSAITIVVRRPVHRIRVGAFSPAMLRERLCSTHDRDDLFGSPDSDLRVAEAAVLCHLDLEPSSVRFTRLPSGNLCTRLQVAGISSRTRDLLAVYDVIPTSVSHSLN